MSVLRWIRSPRTEQHYQRNRHRSSSVPHSHRCLQQPAEVSTRSFTNSLRTQCSVQLLRSGNVLRSRSRTDARRADCLPWFHLPHYPVLLHRRVIRRTSLFHLLQAAAAAPLSSLPSFESNRRRTVRSKSAERQRMRVFRLGCTSGMTSPDISTKTKMPISIRRCRTICEISRRRVT